MASSTVAQTTNTVLRVKARQRNARVVVVGAFAALCVTVVVALGTGAMDISSAEVIRILLSELRLPIEPLSEGREHQVITVIRLPRVVAGVLVGATLAVSGGVLQGLFRNPLAGPGLIGVSSGASLAAAAIIVLAPGGASFWMRPTAAFFGSALVTALVYLLATRAGRTDMATMLLAGVALNALAGAGTGLLTFIADDDQLRDITFWSLGSLGGISWRMIRVTAPIMIVGIVLPARFARPLNVILLGERDAKHVGVNVQVLKVVCVGCVAAAVGAAVAISGTIGFVGLVAPHLVRLSIGPDHRTLLPGAAIVGATLLLLADLFARTVAAPAEVPIGIVTALVGGPFFLWLLLRYRRRSVYA
ncbi:MAG: FecCD family ABC transporter permease [Spirochaetales bacterium]